MQNSSTQTTAVLFMRARYLGCDTRDRNIEHGMIAAQRAACERTADALGAEIIREYVEYGGSGCIANRPELRLLLDELRALRDVRYVIVTHPDRLARTVSDWAAIHLELEAAGAELVIAMNSVTAKDREGVTV